MNILSERIKEYENEYMHDYSFEKVMVWSRQKYVELLIRKLKPTKVLEIGCGFDQLFERVADVSSIQKWTIVEPSDVFYSTARERLIADGRVEIIQGFVEEVIKDNYSLNVELCICSGLLHEVELPEEILHAANKSLCKEGVLHVNVPNAKSFHRLLAYEMGVISSPYEFSNRNVALSQFHVFDANSLRLLIEKSDLEVTDVGGYFIKPFTHAQMEKVIDCIGDNVLDGLWSMGAKYPELASEIFVNAKRRK